MATVLVSPQRRRGGPAEGVSLRGHRADGHVRDDLEVAYEPGHGIAAALEYARQPGKLGVEIAPPGYARNNLNQSTEPLLARVLKLRYSSAEAPSPTLRSLAGVLWPVNGGEPKAAVRTRVVSAANLVSRDALCRDIRGARSAN